MTRAPAQQGVYGDYLQNAQGEDVVAGIRNTVPLQDLERIDPQSYAELMQIMRPWRTTTGTCATSSSPSSAASCGCCRPGSASAPRRPRSGSPIQLVDQGMIDMDEALDRVTGDQLAQLMFPRFDTSGQVKKITKAISASPGAAVGKAVFDSATAVQQAAAGEEVILVRRETNPDDLHGMIASQGILTSRGGKTSHAAVVARGHGQDLRLRRR